LCYDAKRSFLYPDGGALPAERVRDKGNFLKVRADCAALGALAGVVGGAVGRLELHGTLPHPQTGRKLAEILGGWFWPSVDPEP
jgi:hypothetical protein